MSPFESLLCFRREMVGCVEHLELHLALTAHRSVVIRPDIADREQDGEQRENRDSLHGFLFYAIKFFEVTRDSRGVSLTLAERIYTHYKEGSMLTAEDKEDIRRIVAETVLANLADSANEGQKRAEEIEQFERLLKLAVQLHDLIAHEGFTDLTFVNPRTGEMRVVEVKSQSKPIVEVAARAMEVFGTREKALRWLNTPVRSLGDQTPLSLLDTPEGVVQVQDTLGRVEHGVW